MDKTTRALTQLSADLDHELICGLGSSAEPMLKGAYIFPLYSHLKHNHWIALTIVAARGGTRLSTEFICAMRDIYNAQRFHFPSLIHPPKIEYDTRFRREKFNPGPARGDCIYIIISKVKKACYRPQSMRLVIEEIAGATYLDARWYEETKSRDGQGSCVHDCDYTVWLSKSTPVAIAYTPIKEPGALAARRPVHASTPNPKPSPLYCIRMPKRKRWDDEEDKDTWRRFFSRSTHLSVLSNFGPHTVKVNGRIYANGEAAFHGEKFLCVARTTPKGEERRLLQDHATRFKGTADPATAKKMGGKSGFKLRPEQLEQWDQKVAVQIQRAICRYKVANHTDVRNALLSTKSAPLLHQNNRAKETDVWGGRVDKNTGKLIGQNQLGQIWMKVREQIRQDIE